MPSGAEEEDGQSDGKLSKANRYFEEIEELEEVLVERCVALRDQPELIRSHLRYHWWPNAA